MVVSVVVVVVVVIVVVVMVLVVPAVGSVVVWAVMMLVVMNLCVPSMNIFTVEKEKIINVKLFIPPRVYSPFRINNSLILKW